MSIELVVRLPSSPTPPTQPIDLPALLDSSGDDARAVFDKQKGQPGVHLLLAGTPPYAVTLRAPSSDELQKTLGAWKGRNVQVVFTGRSPVRRRLDTIASVAATGPAITPMPAAGIVDLTASAPGSSPLFVLADGTFSTSSTTTQPGLDAREALVRAARWVSTRRTTTFERFFAPDLFHPEKPARTERLTLAQAPNLLAQLDGALAAAAVGSAEAKRSADDAAELRSACLTVLSHLVATVQKDATFRPIADQAAARIFTLVAGEQGDAAKSILRAHAILLLQQRGPALNPSDRARAVELVRTLVRAAPPYKDLAGAWSFALCNADTFHEGECKVLMNTHKFKEVTPLPADAPKSPERLGSAYRCFEAPFPNPSGASIRVYARIANPTDENLEMGMKEFVGLMLNRHAQLGSFDMVATATGVKQQGYKLMMNSECAGLTTRFALTRAFPDADIYSSWDSTFFRTSDTAGGGEDGEVTASEGMDCFVAILQGMAAAETHAEINDRIRKAQWDHEQASAQADYVQFVGPAFPLVIARFSDVNDDGKGELYDGFLDFAIREIAEDVRSSSTPRDPGVAASQIGGEAARGIAWAAGSMDRVTQYSDIWAGMPGESERFYAFQSAGFFSQREPPVDVPVAAQPVEDLGKLPSVCRYGSLYDKGASSPGGLRAEVMLHSWLSHAGKEYKRLLVAAEAMWRAYDLGYLPKTGDVATPLGRRGALLLTLAGLLEFPADENYLDALWSAALKQLNLPDVSRTVVRNCITQEDHDASNYYGSLRGLGQLIGDGKSAKGDLGKADAVAYAKLQSTDVRIGRASELAIDASVPQVSPPLVA